MITYNELYNDVKNTLSEKRFKHSEGVVKRALEYAKIYNVDVETIKLVAIAHDIAKEFTEEENKEFIEKYNIQLDEIEKTNKNLLHSKIGACICKDKYGFTDDMANAVKYHTTGKDNMSILEKVIYLADATEENRNYIDIDYYVDTVKENIDKAMCEVSKWVINVLLERNSAVHLDTVKCYNYYRNQQ